MLIGPSHRSFLPRVPDPSEGLDGIYRYLEDFDRAASHYLSAIVANTVGLVGVRGISSTGTVSQNFIGRLMISAVTQASFIFTGLEANVSYMVFSQPSVSSGVSITGITAETSRILFDFGSVTPTNASLNILILR